LGQVEVDGGVVSELLVCVFFFFFFSKNLGSSSG